MNYLHLNKYLIQIINNYIIVDIDKLITTKLNKKTIFRSFLRCIYTIEDLIIKCIHYGYRGFYINSSTNKDNEILVNYINSLSNENIEIRNQNHQIFYSFLKDQRKLTYLDIFKLDIFKHEKLTIHI